MATLIDIQEILGEKITFGRTLAGDYFADLPKVEWKTHSTDGVLTSAVGFGKTKRDACRDLAAKLQGKVAVQNAWTAFYRKEIQMPSKISGYRW